MNRRTTQRKLIKPKLSPYELATLLRFVLSDSSFLRANDGGTGAVTPGTGIGWAENLSGGAPILQDNEDARPTLVAGAINGYPAAEFTQADASRLSTEADTTLINPGTTPYILFVVAGALGAAGSARTIFDSKSASQRNVGYHSASNDYRISAGTVRSGGSVDANWHLLEFEFNAIASKVVADGVTVVSPGSVGLQRLDGLTVGSKYDGTEALTGRIAEVLAIRTTILTARDRNLLRNYFRAKYNLP